MSITTFVNFQQSFGDPPPNYIIAVLVGLFLLCTTLIVIICFVIRNKRRIDRQKEDIEFAEASDQSTDLSHLNRNRYRVLDFKSSVLYKNVNILNNEKRNE